LFLVLLVEIRDPLVRDQTDASALVPNAVDLAVETTERPRSEAGHPGHRAMQTWRRFVNDIGTESIVSCIAIVGAESRQGCSTVAWNLASSLALRGEKTVLVDADLRAETVQRLSALHKRGFTDVIAGRNSLSECLTPSSMCQLRLLPAGTEIGSHSALTLLGTSGARELAMRLHQMPDRVIIDLPPLADNEAALEFAAAIGTVVFVSRSGSTERSTATNLIDRLGARGVRVLGSVVLDVPKGRMPGMSRARFCLRGQEFFSSWSESIPEVQHA
jgi:Mrp family chromosome partitioning ATPase